MSEPGKEIEISFPLSSKIVPTSRIQEILEASRSENLRNRWLEAWRRQDVSRTVTDLSTLTAEEPGIAQTRPTLPTYVSDTSELLRLYIADEVRRALADQGIVARSTSALTVEEEPGEESTLLITTTPLGSLKTEKDVRSSKVAAYTPLAVLGLTIATSGASAATLLNVLTNRMASSWNGLIAIFVSLLVAFAVVVALSLRSWRKRRLARESDPITDPALLRVLGQHLVSPRSSDPVKSEPL